MVNEINIYNEKLNEIIKDSIKAYKSGRFNEFIRLKYLLVEKVAEILFLKKFGEKVKQEQNLRLFRMLSKLKEKINGNIINLEEFDKWRKLRNKIVHEHFKIDKIKASAGKVFFDNLSNKLIKILEREGKSGLEKLNNFKGAQIPQYEINVLEQIEKSLDKEFEHVPETELGTKMGFTTRDQNVSGIGLNKCDIYSLPKSLKFLVGVKSLMLSNNNLLTLPKTIGKLISLEQLEITYNNLTQLPKSIGYFTSLRILRIQNNLLPSIPESIGNLVSLKFLNLKDNRISALPDTIGNLESLESFNLERNSLSKLPDSIGNLKSLKFLNLKYNRLNSLPESIGKLKSLESLHLRGNQMVNFSPSIKDLTSLKTLDLRDNSISFQLDFIENMKENGTQVYL